MVGKLVKCNDNFNHVFNINLLTAQSSCIDSQADVDHIKAQGWNAIRLGVVWAGAQPRDENALDPEFLSRLDAILNLTDRNKIHVILDNHGDMTSSAGCGNGVSTIRSFL